MPKLSKNVQLWSVFTAQCGRMNTLLFAAFPYLLLLLLPIQKEAQFDIPVLFMITMGAVIKDLGSNLALFWGTTKQHNRLLIWWTAGGRSEWHLCKIFLDSKTFLVINHVSIVCSLKKEAESWENLTTLRNFSDTFGKISIIN